MPIKFHPDGEGGCRSFMSESLVICGGMTTRTRLANGGPGVSHEVDLIFLRASRAEEEYAPDIRPLSYRTARKAQPHGLLFAAQGSDP